MHVRETELREKKGATEQREKGFAGNREYLLKFYESEHLTQAEKSYQCETKQIISKIPEEKTMGGETFAGVGSSIQVQPGRAAQASQRNYKKNPAVAAAGR
jgi:hypothetical protein